jgi:hypothetical protein
LFIEYLSGYSYPDPDGYIESIWVSLIYPSNYIVIFESESSSLIYGSPFLVPTMLILVFPGVRG